MGYKKYYVKASHNCLKALARRLIFCCEPFSYDGGLTISFTIDEDRVKWIKGTLESIRRRSESDKTVHEVEVYDV